MIVTLDVNVGRPRKVPTTTSGLGKVLAGLISNKVYIDCKYQILIVREGGRYQERSIESWDDSRGGYSIML